MLNSTKQDTLEETLVAIRCDSAVEQYEETCSELNRKH